MAGKTIYDGSVKSQSIDAVKALLAWKGRSSDPLPSVVEFKSEEEGDSRLMLILSNKKDLYYTVTAMACSCPAALYRGGPCKHQRKYFSLKPHATTAPSNVRPASKWPGGFNGPVNEIRGEA
jgi:hypothetical protein